MHPARMPLILMALLTACFVAYLTGVMARVTYFLALASLLGFSFGRLSVVNEYERHSRRQAIAHCEQMIAGIHRDLARDDLDDRQRELGEAAIASATDALSALEASAPPWTRWRERRAREKASRG